MAAEAAPAQPATLDPERGLRAPPRSGPAALPGARPAGRPARVRRPRPGGRRRLPGRVAGDRPAPRGGADQATRRATSPGACGTASTSASCGRVQPRLVRVHRGRRRAHGRDARGSGAARRGSANRPARAVLAAASQRRALVLRALGLPHRDVAASLGVSPLRARKLADAGRREFGVRVAAGEQGSPCAATASCLRRSRPAGTSAHTGALASMRISTPARRAAGRSRRCAARALAAGRLVIAAPDGGSSYSRAS